MSDREMTGAEELRLAISNIDCMSENFNDHFTAEQLLQLMRMCWKSGWDILPDRWTQRQVKAALRGTVPQWDQDEKPIY